MFDTRQMQQFQKELPHLFVTAKMRMDSMTYRFTDVPYGSGGKVQGNPGTAVFLTVDRDGEPVEAYARQKTSADTYTIFPFLKDGQLDTGLETTKVLLDTFLCRMEEKQVEGKATAYDDFESLAYYLEEKLAGCPSAARGMGYEPVDTAAQEDPDWAFEEDGMEPEI
jgi:hypothetical protein